MSLSVFENLPQDILLKISSLVTKEYINFVKSYKIRRQKRRYNQITNMLIKDLYIDYNEDYMTENYGEDYDYDSDEELSLMVPSNTLEYPASYEDFSEYVKIGDAIENITEVKDIIKLEKYKDEKFCIYGYLPSNGCECCFSPIKYFFDCMFRYQKRKFNNITLHNVASGRKLVQIYYNKYINIRRLIVVTNNILEVLNLPKDYQNFLIVLVKPLIYQNVINIFLEQNKNNVLYNHENRFLMLDGTKITINNSSTVRDLWLFCDQDILMNGKIIKNINEDNIKFCIKYLE